jgi:hypothetical protein
MVLDHLDEAVERSFCFSLLLAEQREMRRKMGHAISGEDWSLAKPKKKRHWISSAEEGVAHGLLLLRPVCEAQNSLVPWCRAILVTPYQPPVCMDQKKGP